LVVEEFKIECTLANFLTKTKLALELNDPTITATLNDFEDSIGSSLVQLFSQFDSEFDEKISSEADTTFEAQAKLVLDDDTLYTSDEELEEFANSIKEYSTAQSQRIHENIVGAATTASQTLEGSLVEDIAEGTLKDRLLARIQAVSDEVEQQRQAILSSIQSSKEDNRKRWLELALGSEVNGIRSRIIYWSLITDQSPNATDDLLQIVDDAFFLTKAHNSKYVQCNAAYNSALSTSNPLDLFVELQTTYKCLLQQLYT